MERPRQLRVHRDSVFGKLPSDCVCTWTAVFLASLYIVSAQERRFLSGSLDFASAREAVIVCVPGK